MRKKVLSLLALLLMATTGAVAQTTYTVTVKDGTEDAAKWTADPNPATAGQTVTVTYSGTRHVKSVKAVKKAAAADVALDATSTAWTENSTIADDLTISSAVTVSADITLTIPEGKTLTVNGGINATGYTLTVKGAGTLNVTGTNGANGSGIHSYMGDYVGNAGDVGSAGFTGTLVIDGAAVNVTGGNGGKGADGENGAGNGGNGAAGVSSSITVNSGSATVTGGNGGNVGATYLTTNPATAAVAAAAFPAA